ncbi:hypothetical protein G3M81_05060 [Bacillus paralicheniformis]|uniref:hypothetical protein n=1 Tax=Bacillus paralicheniformis TaxID=1648923 RepID=UPI0013EF2742|nr:hypothetical protein [Bacillus paralicheniformis]QII48141.1 hypothetical protein G3M81_05060 [Bacillus paralicheniformis]
MEIKLTQAEVQSALNDYVRKKGLNVGVKRVEYFGPYGDFIRHLDYAVIEFETKEGE